MVQKQRIGVIGLGDMGLPIAKNLLAAGYSVRGYDLEEEKMVRLETSGGERAHDIGEIVETSDCVCTSLPSSGTFIQVAGDELLPRVGEGQVFIEFGTTVPHEVRRLAGAFADRGAVLLDVPVSGGPGGVKNRKLYMFAGGDREAVDACRPLLVAVGGETGLYYCGPSGSGQAMKGVNQLWMGLLNAALLEAVAFGVRSGLDVELIREAFEGRDWKGLSVIAGNVAQEQGDLEGVKFRELPYFIREAEKQGYRLPIAEAVHAFCDRGERVVVDDHREAPSFWHELMIKECDKG